MCSNCGSGFAGFMSPHHIDLPSREESKNCHLTKSRRGKGGEVGGAHYYLGQQEDGGQLKSHERPNSFKTVFLLLQQRNNARGLNANYITETITPKNKRETRNALRTHSHGSQRTRKDQDANSSVAFFLLAADIFFTTKDAQRGPFNYDHHYHPILFASVLYSSHVILFCAKKAICQV